MTRCSRSPACLAQSEIFFFFALDSISDMPAHALITRAAAQPTGTGRASPPPRQAWGEGPGTGARGGERERREEEAPPPERAPSC